MKWVHGRDYVGVFRRRLGRTSDCRQDNDAQHQQRFFFFLGGCPNSFFFGFFFVKLNFPRMTLFMGADGLTRTQADRADRAKHRAAQRRRARCARRRSNAGAPCVRPGVAAARHRSWIRLGPALGGIGSDARSAWCGRSGHALPGMWHEHREGEEARLRFCLYLHAVVQARNSAA